MSTENIDKFISALAKSLHEETFVKMTLGNYRGNDPHLQKLLIRLIKTKKGTRLFFLYRFETRDMAKNYSFPGGIDLIRRGLGKDYFAGHLFTTDHNFQLDIGKKGRSRLNIGKPTFKTKPVLDHDHQKARIIDRNSFYLKALGITTETGEIRSKQNDKWKQINKFVETLDNLVKDSDLTGKKNLKIVDMGSGKGYLTFAAYDFFKNICGIETEVTGIDTKQQLVDLCNHIARASEFTGLEFIRGYIDDQSWPAIDILIALHACNTATDDAIFKGIKANAQLIVVAPCCHREIRPQIKPPQMLKNILRHGIMLEREAETITDGLRALLLEKSGYSTRLFEFISTAHTPKNNMIVGTKDPRLKNAPEIEKQIRELKDFYGIENHHLEDLLGN
jgi:SAM-dependent methyltransferase